jgi:hypothetical protein
MVAYPVPIINLVSGSGNISSNPVVEPPGTFNWAQSLSVTPGSTATVVNLLNTPAGYQIKGMLCHGTGEGYFFIQINNLTVASGRIRLTKPMIEVYFKNGISVPTGSQVTLKVTNESTSTADYEVTLFGV